VNKIFEQISWVSFLVMAAGFLGCFLVCIVVSFENFTITNDLLFIFSILVVSLAIGGLATGMMNNYLWERWVWNGGICRETGLPWESTDTDSQGGVLYCSGVHTVWLSSRFRRQDGNEA